MHLTHMLKPAAFPSGTAEHSPSVFCTFFHASSPPSTSSSCFCCSLACFDICVQAMQPDSNNSRSEHSPRQWLERAHTASTHVTVALQVQMQQQDE